MTTQRLGRPALTDLINRVKDSTGLSYRDLAERAGHAVSYQQLAEHGKGAVVKAPDAEQVDAIAAALHVSVATVRRAVFIQYYGYDPDMPGDTVSDDLIPDDLTPDERDELRRVIQAWLAVKRPAKGAVRRSTDRRAAGSREEAPRSQR